MANFHHVKDYSKEPLITSCGITVKRKGFRKEANVSTTMWEDAVQCKKCLKKLHEEKGGKNG